MGVWFIPLAVVGGTARFVIKRPILSAVGAVIGWEFFTEDNEQVGYWDVQDIEQAFRELGAQGLSVVGDAGEAAFASLGDAIPEIIERLGPSIITGINNTVKAVRQELVGNEVRVIATGMTVLLIFSTWLYVTSWVRGVGASAGQGGL